MIEQQGRVISVQPGEAWVETMRSSACNACNMKAGCGQGGLAKLGWGQSTSTLKVKSNVTVQLGDAVIFAIDEHLLLKSALWFYLFPLLGFFFAAIVTGQMGLHEPFVIIAGLLGFWIAWLWMRSHRYRNDDPAQYPVIIRVIGSSDTA